MKMMPELKSSRFIYPITCLCALLHAAYPDFEFCIIAKNAGTFGRDLGAKFSLNDSKK